MPANNKVIDAGSGTITNDESGDDSEWMTFWSIGLMPPAGPTLYCQIVQSLNTPVVEGWPVCGSPKFARIQRSRLATHLSISPSAKREVVYTIGSAPGPLRATTSLTKVSTQSVRSEVERV